jgi:hypothetical protein
MVELTRLRAKTGLDVAQAFAPSQLSEGEAWILVQAREALDPLLAAIAYDTPTKCRQRQMLHELGKDIATFVHRALPRDGHVARSARIRIPIEIETASKSQFCVPKALSNVKCWDSSGTT